MLKLFRGSVAGLTLFILTCSLLFARIIPLENTIKVSVTGPQPGAVCTNDKATWKLTAMPAKPVNAKFIKDEFKEGGKFDWQWKVLKVQTNAVSLKDDNWQDDPDFNPDPAKSKHKLTVTRTSQELMKSDADLVGTFVTIGFKRVFVEATLTFDGKDGNEYKLSGVSMDAVVAVLKVEVVSITVKSGATQTNVTGAENWAAVRADDDVIVEATLKPNTNEVGAAVMWTGGDPVPGKPRQRKVSKKNSVKTTVKVECGATSAQLVIWILWATIENKITGTTPANAVQFGKSYDGTENLGAQTFKGGNAAVGKIVPIATITPAGVHDVVKAGWTFHRDKFEHDFTDGEKNAAFYDKDWNVDNSFPQLQKLVPDADDKIYDRDAPNIDNFGNQTDERYMNFRQFVKWNGKEASDFAGWFWKARWKKDATPQVTLKEIGQGAIELPNKAFYPKP